MTKTRSMTINENHGYASSTKRIDACDKGGVPSWSDLNHDVLFLVMMRLGVIDFVSFSGVCKSWRSLVLSNRKMFMASKPPMSIHISSVDVNEKEWYFSLKDFEGRKFKTILPHFAGSTFAGLTCGYLVLFGKEKNDCWLVNPITRHELHFPGVPFLVKEYRVNVVLVFSPSISGWVFVVINRSTHKIWFSIAGKGEWNHVYSPSSIVEIHAFKGKIYTVDNARHICEMRFNPNPKLTFLQTINIPKPYGVRPEFVRSVENLYVRRKNRQHPYVYELDFGEMKWVLTKEKTIGDFVFFTSRSGRVVAIKPESWATDARSQYYNGNDFLRDSSGSSPYHGLFYTCAWYFPHLCLNVDLIDE